MSRARAFAFTLNNWTDEEYASVSSLALDASYLVIGKETGAEGTPHLQGYVYFSSPRFFAALKKRLPRAHIEPAKGNADQNKVYCSKGGDFREWGELPRQGKRSDIDTVREVLAATPKMEAAVDASRSYQATKFAEQWLKYKEPPRSSETAPEVHWYYGPPGSGKSRDASTAAPTAYRCQGSIKWWDGYDGHTDVIIDDMRKDFCKYHELLRLLDRYPFRVEIKGGMRQFMAKRIFITAPYAPEEMYETREDLGQLMRRVTHIRKYYVGGKYDIIQDAESCQDSAGRSSA